MGKQVLVAPSSNATIKTMDSEGEDEIDRYKDSVDYHSSSARSVALSGFSADSAELDRCE